MCFNLPLEHFKLIFQKKVMQFKKQIHTFFLLLGDRSGNDCNYVISNLQVIKLVFVVALWIFFLIPQVRPILDSLIYSYVRSPMMTWLWTVSLEWSCMGCHVSLFPHSALKFLKMKPNFLPFQSYFTEFNSYAWN